MDHSSDLRPEAGEANLELGGTPFPLPEEVALLGLGGSAGALLCGSGVRLLFG